MRKFHSLNRRKDSGIGVIAFVLMIPVAIVGLALLTFCFFEARKAYWDFRVREMCAQDGGLKVFQVLQLTPVQYGLLLNKFGKLAPPSRDSVDLAPVYTSYERKVIRRNYPEVSRDELKIVDASTQKVLGQSVTYSRVGGDLLAFHPSIFSCPAIALNLTAATLQKGGEK